jgi:hypothetical protein
MRVKSRSNRYQKGIIDYLFLVLILIVAILLASGRSVLPPSDSKFRVTTDNADSSTRDSLQLNTLKVEKCPDVAIGLLVDVSGSMILPPTKLQELKTALHSISNYLTDDSLIALYTFSGRDDKFQNPPQELIPFSKWKDISAEYSTTVDSLTARGSTYTRDALQFVEPHLLTARKEYPQYKDFTLLLFTDGIPYIYPPKDSCNIQNPQSCFSSEQDPTESPDISQEIKDNGITIYTIAFNGDLDRSSSDKLETMLKKIASKPDNYYSAQQAGDLSGIFKQIGQKLCQ